MYQEILQNHEDETLQIYFEGLQSFLDQKEALKIAIDKCNSNIKVSYSHCLSSPMKHNLRREET